MMQHKNGLILILSLLSVLFYSSVQAASDARLYLTVSNVSNEQFSPQSKTISVNVENAPLIYGADIRLSFDPSMLEVINMEAGSFIDREQGLILQEQHDNQNGSVDYALALRNPAPPVEGAGTLLNVTFQAKNAGQAPVRLEQGQFGTQKGDVIDATLGDVMLDFTENDQKPSPADPEAEDNDDEKSENDTQIGEKYGLSTMWLLLLGVLGGGVVVLGGQFFFYRVRRRSSIADKF